MSVSKGLARLGRSKGAGTVSLSLERRDGWFPVGKRRELSSDAAMKISAVSACVEIISNAVGMLPVFIMDSSSKQRLGSHPLGRVLWSRPNEAMSPFIFFRLMECQRLLRGNAYAWIYRSGYGEPAELIPLPPSTCEPVIEPGTGKLWYLAAEPKTGRAYKLDPADILHYKAYSPDGVSGVSVLHRAQQTLQTAAAAQSYEKALYENGGRPSGILKVITNDDGLLWLGTLKDANGRYLLMPNPADPQQLRLCIGPHTLPVKTYDNDTIPTNEGKIPVVLGDLTEGVVYWDRRQFTVKVSDTAVVGDFNAFEQDMTIWRKVQPGGCSTIWR